MPTNNISSEVIGQVGIPPIVFLYTVDQLASMLNISEKRIFDSYLYYHGRSSGMRPRHTMRAINIAPDDEKAEWRVEAREFISFLRRMGLRTYELTHIDVP